MKLSELASLTSARVEGASSDIEISGAAGLDDAGPGQVTFLANPRYTPKVNSTQARQFIFRKMPDDRELRPCEPQIRIWHIRER